MDLRDKMTMTSSEVEEYLCSSGVGVISVPTDGTPYSIPLSFGYDTSTQVIYFQLSHAPWSRKRELIQMADTVSFVVFDIDEDSSSRSVVIEGTLSSVSDSEKKTALEALANNAQFTALHESGTSLEESEIELIQLEPETVSGRKYESPTLEELGDQLANKP